MTAKKWPLIEMQVREVSGTDSIIYVPELGDRFLVATSLADYLTQSHAAPEVPGEVKAALEFLRHVHADHWAVDLNQIVPMIDRALKSLEGCREAVGDDEIEKLANKSAQDFIDRVEGPKSACGFSDPSERGSVKCWWPRGFKAGFKAALERGSK